MKDELFPFQKRAVAELRMKAAEALGSYHRTKTPQVISLQAPTGAGKTIIMASFVEEVYFGGDNYVDQPEAIFVWLSDSPALNEQSKEKFQLRADKLQFSQCVTIKETSFDMEMLEDGKIYFLNTQKLSKAGNLSKHSDKRQNTIWETLENTAREKSDRLYFIIDEAHRGMQGKEAGKATSIMQRFLKGAKDLGLSPMPLVIGISATSARFHQLVGDTTSTLNKCIVTANEVRSSGLLKDRIVITYPDDPQKTNDMAILQAATDEWKKKCTHWYQYSYEQHYAQVNPVFVIQVLAGRGNTVSDTNLDDVVAAIEERVGTRFKENEVVHTFGSTSTLTINGLAVPHVEPSDITSDKRIRVVLFKENLSTGWDCPRAETMMSFRRAEDATYIAQLLGRMVRTPLQCHVQVDEYLNDVRLFLPYFNKATVKEVIDELQNTEGGEIPTVIDEEALGQSKYAILSVHPRKKEDTPIEGQCQLDGLDALDQPYVTAPPSVDPAIDTAVRRPHPQQEPTPLYSPAPKTPQAEQVPSEEQGEQLTIPGAVEIDREAVIKFINEQGLLTYVVRTTRVSDYLKSLLSLVSLLTQFNICPTASDDIKDEVTNMIHAYAQALRASGKYDTLASQVLSMKLAVKVFDVFGAALDAESTYNALMPENDLDRQLRIADAKLGGYGFQNRYGTTFYDEDDPNAFKIDCILFAADDDCLATLGSYAEKKFHELNDKYRRNVVKKSDQCKRQYYEIIANGDVVSKHSLSLPETISIPVDEDGKEYYDHLYADEKGLAKVKLNRWEAGVLEEEANRPEFVCWLRNQPKARWALCVPYEIEGVTKAMYPDFLVVRQDEDGGYVIDILEPHGADWKDNLGKAKGLAQYAEDEPAIGRVQLIRQSKGPADKLRFKRLDFSQGKVRDQVKKAINTDELDHIFEDWGFFI